MPMECDATLTHIIVVSAMDFLSLSLAVQRRFSPKPTGQQATFEGHLQRKNIVIHTVYTNQNHFRNCSIPFTFRPSGIL